MLPVRPGIGYAQRRLAVDNAVTSSFILFDDARRRPATALLFSRPFEWIVCDAPGDVDAALARAEAAQAAGRFVAGWLAYELGYVLEPKLAPLLPAVRDGPLLALGVWPAPSRLGGSEIDAWLSSAAAGTCRLAPLQPVWPATSYRRAFDRVRAYIAAGDVYQVNLTFPLIGPVAGEPAGLYRDLRRRARAGHGALFHRPGETILSLSPELFVAVDAGIVRARPMKGTAGREPGLEEDRVAAAALAADEKQRAENLMIVDLLRNDLGRVADIGSVAVDDLFTVETYPHLHTMTSGISARLQAGTGLAALLRAIFPCGSVTGAPKIRAMQIIRELEAAPRGVYCGAIGWLAPNGDAAFNVAIRTLVVRDGIARLGVGSGLVFDSEAEAEYRECLLKARFARPEPPFALLETLRWQAGGGYWLLDRHLRRLQQSAEYFQYPCDGAEVRRALAGMAAKLGRQGGTHRVRLLVDDAGGVTVGSAPLATDGAGTPWPLLLSPRRTSSRDPFVRHKTTRRQLYDDEYARLFPTGAGEVLFLNERGELTEGSRTTLFVERDGILYTPPLSAGALAGVLRAELIAAGRVRERPLYPRDLLGADAVFVGNSVRGLVPAVFDARSGPG
jgi:para-aminobenzoate synthetase/4-amino-4-deoxychorismate lyase